MESIASICVCLAHTGLIKIDYDAWEWRFNGDAHADKRPEGARLLTWPWRANVLSFASDFNDKKKKKKPRPAVQRARGA